MSSIRCGSFPSKKGPQVLLYHDLDRQRPLRKRRAPQPIQARFRRLHFDNDQIDARRRRQNGLDAGDPKHCLARLPHDPAILARITSHGDCSRSKPLSRTSSRRNSSRRNSSSSNSARSNFKTTSTAHVLRPVVLSQKRPCTRWTPRDPSGSRRSNQVPSGPLMSLHVPSCPIKSPQVLSPVTATSCPPKRDLGANFCRFAAFRGSSPSLPAISSLVSGPSGPPFNQIFPDSPVKIQFVAVYKPTVAIANPESAKNCRTAPPPSTKKCRYQRVRHQH